MITKSINRVVRYQQRLCVSNKTVFIFYGLYHAAGQKVKPEILKCVFKPLLPAFKCKLPRHFCTAACVFLIIPRPGVFQPFVAVAVTEGNGTEAFFVFGF